MGCRNLHCICLFTLHLFFYCLICVAAPSYFPESHLKYLPFQRWFEFGEKPEVTGRQIWAVWGLSHVGDLIFRQKILHKTWYMSWAHCCDEAANHQLPMAAAFWIIRIVSAEECSGLMQNLMHIRCCTYSVILNAAATQYTYSVVSTAAIN